MNWRKGDYAFCRKIGQHVRVIHSNKKETYVERNSGKVRRYVPTESLEAPEIDGIGGHELGALIRSAVDYKAPVEPH